MKQAKKDTSEGVRKAKKAIQRSKGIESRAKAQLAKRKVSLQEQE